MSAIEEVKQLVEQAEGYVLLQEHGDLEKRFLSEAGERFSPHAPGGEGIYVVRTGAGHHPAEAWYPHELKAVRIIANTRTDDLGVVVEPGTDWGLEVTYLMGAEWAGPL